MSEVDIDVWAEGERLRLEAFIKFWRDSNSVNPEHFPDRMPEGEWDEQFRAFEA